MITYLVQRLILALLTVWAISVLSFVIIQLPPGDYITSYIAQMSASGGAVSEQEADALRQEYGLDKPMLVQYLRWMKQVAAGAVRHGAGVEAPGLRGHRRPALAHHGRLGGRHPPHVAPRASDRHLLGRPPVLCRGLRGDVHRLHRSRRPELHARPRPHVPRIPVLQHEHRRSVLGRVRRGAVEPGQGVGPDRSTSRCPPSSWGWPAPRSSSGSCARTCSTSSGSRT